MSTSPSSTPSNLRLSRRAATILQSEIRNMSLECDRVGGINLSQGVCDTPVPVEVKQGAFDGVEEGFNIYTRYDGLDELRHAIAARRQKDYGVAVDPDSQIVVSAGATGALYCTCLALLDRGDEVVLFEPYYGYHVNTLLSVDAVPTYVPMRPPDWTFSMDDLERAITPRTRAILVNTPGNPSGKVFTRAELEQVAEVAARHDLFIFTDEIYEYFVYDGRTHVTPASLAGVADRTISISGFSKTFSITGWRIGYSVSSPRWTETIGHYNDLVYVCAPAPLQIGVARGLAALGPKYYASLTGEYLAKRDQICDVLRAVGLMPHVPQGAYYVLADVSRLPGRSSKERAMHLLEKTGVAAVPGDAFFNEGRGSSLVRFCYAKSKADLDEACNRLERLAHAG
jgi:aminotransferase